MKRFAQISVIILTALLSASCSWNRIGDLSVKSYEITRLYTRSLSDFDVSASLQTENNGPTLTFSEIKGELYHLGQHICSVDFTEPFTIPGKTISWVNVSASVKVDPDCILAIIDMVKGTDPSKFTISVEGKVQLGKNGIKAKVKKEDIPLSQILRNKEQ